MLGTCMYKRQEVSEKRKESDNMYNGSTAKYVYFWTVSRVFHLIGRVLIFKTPNEHVSEVNWTPGLL